MLKAHDSRAPLADSGSSHERHVVEDATGVIHCFVALDELRRLLALMAGTELVSAIVQTLPSR